MCRTRCVLALIALYVGVVQSWDFAVTKGDFLEFYTNRTITESVRFDSQNLTALIYNEVHNMMLYVNKQSGDDVICGYDISAFEKKCFTERSGRNIHGLAFDPVSEKLFFSDIKERSINWISSKRGFNNNVYGNLLIKMVDGIPTDLAVDSCRGYVYWINTNLKPPTIERAQFDGANREVIITSVSIDTPNKLQPHSLVIDQQTQKIYWMEPKDSFIYTIFYADLNGNKKQELQSVSIEDSTQLWTQPSSNTLSVSKTKLFWLGWCAYCDIIMWEFPKSTQTPYINFLGKFSLHTTDITVGIAANYKIEEKLPEIQDCDSLISLVRNNSDGPFCVHGKQVNGQSLCKCSPGYIGERCDVSVCNNYCMQGDCSSNDEGHPECRCNAGYSGDRCEKYACSGYCQNNGDCSLNESSEPVCECKEDYVGDRCEVSDCLNYCIQGNCSLTDERLPECRCNAGYSGDRCEKYACSGYCQNNGDCSLNESSEPVCECKEDYVGDRCEVSGCLNYCIQGNCSLTDERLPECRCNAGYSGDRCEKYACSGYCQNNGDCSLNESSERVCECKEDYVGDRCEVSGCLNYCIQGNCSLNDEGLPECRCNAGYSGNRCEVDTCYGHCLNNGVCSLNEEEEPFCECASDDAGPRCELVQNVARTSTDTPKYHPAVTNLTLADLLSKWQKPKMFVLVEE